MFNAIRRALGKPEVYTFPGGIHPDDMKDDTKRKGIVNIKAPQTVVIPLNQHIGAPSVPCVEVGSRVLMGQKIAEAGGFVSANIHSSVSGTVTAIEPRLHPSGNKVMSMVIENDGLDEECKDMKTFTLDEVTPGEIIEAVKEAGIVGMGGATFPTHIKLSPPADKKIEYVIVNGAECEPYLTSDHRVMLEAADEVIDGLRLMLKVFGLKKGYIAIETNKPDAIRHMTYAARRIKDVEINIVQVKTKYPQGSEKHLIKAVTGRTVPSGKLPMDVGVVVNNIDSCAAIARAVLKGMPLIKRIVTVSGDAIERPFNFRVPIGTSFAHLVEACGGFSKTAEKLIMGGPMMGMALTNLDVPVIKGSSGLLAFSRDMLRDEIPQACLRCGKCIDGCPMNLMPNAIKSALCLNDMEKLSKLNVFDCIQCGSCTYVCPADQNPLMYIRTAKNKLKETAK